MQYKNYIIKIEQDDDTMSPREWDNLGQMVCFHRGYNLGDKHNFKTPEDLQDYLEDNKENLIVLPLYLYDHSGITMSTASFSCSWDSGQVGFIYCKKGTEGLTDQQIIENLEAEVKTYDQYLTGDVYGYIVEDLTGEHIDSCWGFYGREDAIAEAKALIDYYERRDLPLLDYVGLIA